MRREIGVMLGETPEPSLGECPHKEKIIELAQELKPQFRLGMIKFHQGGEEHVVNIIVNGVHVSPLRQNRNNQYTSTVLPKITTDLRPRFFNGWPLANNIGLQFRPNPQQLVAAQFCLDPENKVNLFLFSDRHEPKNKDLFTKTRNLIQAKFYD